MDNPVPSALQAAADEAMRTEPNPASAPTPVETPPSVEPAAAPPAAPATPAQPINPAQPPVATPAPDSAPAPAPAVDWKHRFDVVNGKYVKETARLRDQVNQLTAKLEQATQAPAPAAPPPTVTPQATPANEITDEMVKSIATAEQIDEDGIDYWRTVIKAQRALAATNTGTSEEVKELRQSIEQQAEDRFYADLTQLVPDWQTVNAMDEFDAFLEEVDPLSGFSYGALLNEHVKSRDPVRVSNLFAAFAKRNPSQTPTAPTDSTSEQVVPPNSPAPEPQAAPVGMTDDEYVAELQRLITSGLTPMELEIQRKDLIARYKASNKKKSAA